MIAVTAVVMVLMDRAQPGATHNAPSTWSLMKAELIPPVARGPPPIGRTTTEVAGRVTAEAASPTPLPDTPKFALRTVSGVVWVTAAATGFTLAVAVKAPDAPGATDCAILMFNTTRVLPDP